jgi:hypothetical protein
MKNILLGIRVVIEGVLGLFLLVSAIGYSITNYQNLHLDFSAWSFGTVLAFLFFIVVGYYLLRDAIRIKRRLM